MIELDADSAWESVLFGIVSMYIGVNMEKIIMPRNTLKKKVGDGGLALLN